MSGSGGSGIDGIARDLASGAISRRTALRRLAGGALGLAAVASPAVAEAMAGCPEGRERCDGKCCKENARCKHGKCKCKNGFEKCGKKCVDLDTSAKHCGACGNACDEGEVCDGGECVADAECTPGVQCAAATCSNGQKTNARICDGNGTCPPPMFTSCGNYACNPEGTDCRFSCLGPADCAPGFQCNMSLCQP